jgi:membrane-associated phospholipid phosphatase
MPRNCTSRTTHNGLCQASVLVVFALMACSDQETPVAPNPAPVLRGQSSPTEATPLLTTEWQEQARTLVGANRLSPLAAGRVYALLSVGQYRAVVDVSNGRGNDTRPSRDIERGAVAGASWKILSFFFASADAALEQRVRDEANTEGGSNERFMRGVRAGTEAATVMIERAKIDHFTDPWTGTVPVGPGGWIANGPPVLPLLGTMTPYLLQSGSQFRPAPPPAVGSPAFLADLAEVVSFSRTRTAEQLEIAVFWNLPGGTFTPLGYWNKVASEYVAEEGLNEYASAHVLALTHAAVMDALIGCWEAKYYYWYRRPSQADATITLPLGLPNHPSYPSGHACLSAAATTVLTHFFPKRSGELEDGLEEAGMSRIYGGIHYRFDMTAGQALGVSVAREAIRIDGRNGLLSALR